VCFSRKRGEQGAGQNGRHHDQLRLKSCVPVGACMRYVTSGVKAGAGMSRGARSAG